jgi:general secretion pathway protein H
MADKEQRRYRLATGFSLLEILVVIVIVSIVLSFAVLSLDTEPDELDNETQRLTALMKLAAEEAVMNSREYQVLFGEKDYSFQMFTNGQWHDSTDDIFRPRRLPDGFSLSITIENQPVLLEKDPDEKSRRNAVILFLSSNEATPFELSITSPSGLQRTISNLGGIITTGPEQIGQQ